MQISFNGIMLLQELEGFRPNAYLDSANIWTIGYGSTRVDGVPVKEGDIITQAQAEHQLYNDISWAQTCINQNVNTSLTQNQFDSLVCFVYNIGATAFQESTLLKLLNLQCYDLAAAEFDRWNKAGGRVIKGLIKRREKEKELFDK